MIRTTTDRHERLLALLEEQGELELPVLVRALSVSEATLRRDLVRLEETGRLVRTFGGARTMAPASLVARTFGEKRRRMRPEKERMARAAAQLVKPGMIVALDSGTTIWRIASALKSRGPLTLLTSALAPLEELGSVPGMTLKLVGGRFRLENLDFVGVATVAGYRDLHADIAFIGADSFIPGRGAFSLDEGSASVAGAVARCADQRVVVVDHGKFEARGLCMVLPTDQIDVLVTDDGLGEETRGRLQQEPCRLIVAG
jgi:DeoR/GlpR family transcriptional regulator of sugar metabolism